MWKFLKRIFGSRIMSKVQNDIANLLNRFGAKTDSYLEVEAALEYKEAPLAPVVVPVVVAAPAAQAGLMTPVSQAESSPAQTKQPIALVPRMAVAASAPNVTETRVEPVLASVYVAPVQERVASNVEPSTLTSEPATVSVMPAPKSSLRSLLNEVALARQASIQASNEEKAEVVTATPAHVVAVVSLKGGVGKTTISAALAGALAPQGHGFAIDLDPQNALRHHLGAVSDEEESVEGLSGEDWQSSLCDGMVGVKMLPYGIVADKERRVFERRIENDNEWLNRQLIAMKLNTADTVVLDTPPGPTPYMEHALAVADQVVVVITPDAGSFLTLDQLDRQVEGIDHCSFIVNQFDASRTFCQDMLEVLKRRLGDKLIGVIPFDHAISEGLAFGNMPLLTDDASPARQAILSIADALKAQSSKTAGD